MRLLGALVLGAVVSVAALLVHREGGLVLLLAVAASLATGLRLRLADHPAPAAAYSLGWLVVLGIALAGRPEGDWAVGSDLAGYALMGTGLVLVVVGISALPGRRPAHT
ncbi:DUF6113 family protein [Nocardioides mesophilus]|uniref:Integral membrane protein n=1 Tax=Nocardioides mesophilus TaxID=433659 RepID=A0A7G9R7Y7_9ACTN|nr:DUF6113 family protein [Nocardioides mesophilus]QNN51712.1 hypothetical protein H9L09_14230 [Nocardioides mesophilus]